MFWFVHDWIDSSVALTCVGGGKIDSCTACYYRQSITICFAGINHTFHYKKKKRSMSIFMSMVWSLESEEEDQQRGEKMLPRNVLSAFIIMLFVYQSTSIFQFHSTVCLT